MSRYASSVLLLVVSVVATAGSGSARPAQEEIEARLAQVQNGADAEQMAAARWLAFHGIEEAAPLLLALSRRPGEVPAVRDVLRVMGWIAERPRRLRFHAEVEVLEALGGDDAVARAAGVRHLFYLDLGHQRQRALEALDDPAPDVRAAGIEVLGYRDDPRDIPRVMELLDDPDAGVRRQALAYVGRHPAVERVPRVAERLGDADPMVRRGAVGLLRVWGLREPTRDAVARGLRDDRPEVVVRFLEAYGALLPQEERSGTWRDEIAGFLEHDDGAVRLGAAVLLLDVARDRNVGLAGVWTDRRAEPRREAPDPRAVSALRELVASAYTEVRAGAATALARAGVELTTDEVTRLASDPDPAIGRRGVELAARLRLPESLRVLRGVIDSQGSIDTRAAAISMLGAKGDADDLRSLMALGDSGPELLRVNAIQSASLMELRLRTGLVAPWVRGLLEVDDQPLAVHTTAARAAAEVGDDAFLPVLAERLRRCPPSETYLARELSRTISILLGRRVHGPEFAR